MPLDEEVRTLLERLTAEDSRPRSSLTIEETREKYVGMRGLAGEPKPLERVEDLTVSGPGGEIPIRLYASTREDRLPALVYLHGGRFISGNLETHDRVCRDLADRSGWMIIAVDYRLAPEYLFPAAVEDAFAVVSWTGREGLKLGVDPSRIGVGGDSAGGNLAAAVALMASDAGPPRLCCQMLIYPMLDATCSGESHRTMASGYGAGSADMKLGYALYLGETGRPKDPRVSPVFADGLSRLPSTFVLTAEFDSLRDEAELYAARLESAGVPVELVRIPGAIHGIFQMAGVLKSGDSALEQAADFLRSC